MNERPLQPLPPALREWIERPSSTSPETAGDRLRELAEAHPQSQSVPWLRYAAVAALLVGTSWTALQLQPDSPSTVAVQALPNLTPSPAPMLAMTLESGSTLYVPLEKEQQ